MIETIGIGAYRLLNAISVTGCAAVVGQKEGDGPMGHCFDRIEPDSYFGQKTWEQAESRMQQETVYRAMQKANCSPEQLDFITGGDLVNQCTSSTYGLQAFGIPFLGIFGACSTMAEGLAVASLLLAGGTGHHAVAVTSSHFSTAERQFRFPLSYGSQRPPTAQWTCTASGAVVLSASDEQMLSSPKVTGVCIGKIIDLGITDAGNMGAAMAPAAVDTLFRWMNAANRQVSDYDAVVTGDLGLLGGSLFLEMAMQQGFDLSDIYHDCGAMMFDPDTQDTHAGGSGCGCGGSILCGFFLPKIRTGELKRMLFIATGALMSPMLIQQGQSIPGIAHLIEITHEKAVSAV